MKFRGVLNEFKHLFSSFFNFGKTTGQLSGKPVARMAKLGLIVPDVAFWDKFFRSRLTWGATSVASERTIYFKWEKIELTGREKENARDGGAEVTKRAGRDEERKFSRKEQSNNFCSSIVTEREPVFSGVA